MSVQNPLQSIGLLSLLNLISLEFCCTKTIILIEENENKINLHGVAKLAWASRNRLEVSSSLSSKILDTWGLLVASCIHEISLNSNVGWGYPCHSKKKKNGKQNLWNRILFTQTCPWVNAFVAYTNSFFLWYLFWKSSLAFPRNMFRSCLLSSYESCSLGLLNNFFGLSVIFLCATFDDLSILLEISF